MRNNVRKAFTLVEILIVVVILGILAAIVIPQFTNASEEAQTGNIQTQLQTIRSQIELFRVRNNGQLPDMGPGGTANSFADLLAGVNNAYGLNDNNSHQGATETQEPYMRSIPVNPRNRSSVVDDSGIPDPMTAWDPNGPGWYFDTTSGRFAAAGFDESTNTWIDP